MDERGKQSYENRNCVLLRKYLLIEAGKDRTASLVPLTPNRWGIFESSGTHDKLVMLAIPPPDGDSEGDDAGFLEDYGNR